MKERDEHKEPNQKEEGEIKELKKLIYSIQNCNLKKNSQNLILGDGNINSPIMIIGESGSGTDPGTAAIEPRRAGQISKRPRGRPPGTSKADTFLA